MAGPMFDLRFEVAFSTGPDAASPAWVDLSTRLHLPSSVQVRRGRNDEFDQAQPGTLGLTLENIDGALTPDKSGAGFDPNVLPMRRCRLTYRDSATLGARNMLSAESASFEGGTVGSWTPAATTLANDGTKADVGTKSMLITWPTAAAGLNNAANIILTDLAIGRTYTARARLWVPVGVPDMCLAVPSASTGAAMATKGAFATATLTFVATLSTHTLQVRSAGTSTTAGQQTWVDAVMVDEGPTLGTFTTTSMSSAIVPRFDGYIAEWPVEWPDGGELYSRAQVTASDLLGRLGDKRALRSVVVETIALDNPMAHLPLGEAQGSTSAASIAGDALVVTPVQFGTGGTLTFAAGTGVPTDGNSAPTFAPVNATNGLALVATNVFPAGLSSPDTTIVAAFATTSAVNSTIVAVSDGSGSTLEVELLASGKLAATFTDGNLNVSTTIASAATYNDGKTHHVAASLGFEGGGSLLLRLRVDGVANTSIAATVAFPVFDILAIGGAATGGKLFTGTISHVAAFASFVSLARLLEQRLSQTTGFAGERTDQRISRVATWVGLPASRLTLDVGNSTVDHIDSTGLSPLDYLHKVEAVEAGVLFAGADGQLVLHNRARQYTPRAADLSVPSSVLGEDTRLVKNLQQVSNDVTGSRPGGATVRMVDATSQAAYGQLKTTLDLPTTTDASLADAVAWRLNSAKAPLTRFTAMLLDASTDATYSPQVRTAAVIGARVNVTALPAQAPAVQMTQQIQGYTETITDSSWSLSVNATPFDHLAGLVLDDVNAGLLDSFNHIVY